MREMPQTATSMHPPTRRMRLWGMLFGSLWLGFVGVPVRDALSLGTVRGNVTGVLLLGFAGVYLASLVSWWRSSAGGSRVRTVWLLPAGAVLSVAATALGGVDGLATAPVLAVMTLLVWPRWGIIAVVGYAGIAELFSWHLTGSFSERHGIATGVLASGLAVWGILLLVARARDQAARSEAEAALGVAEERARFARDLHDILGRSLTVMAIKAELAGRLVEDAPERAKREIDDLERLSREALADVRRAVQGYREISLAGELLRAAEALRSGDVDADVPEAVTAVPQEREALFAWAVREGVTNVLRHSGARRCTIVIDAVSVSVVDDGSGVARDAAVGSGLAGLRERAAAVGGVVTLERMKPRGSRLRVLVPPGQPHGESARGPQGETDPGTSVVTTGDGP